MFYRRAKPGTAVSPQGKTLFLLHGAIYSSNTWVSTLPTIQTMAAAGFDVVAVDLPGKFTVLRRVVVRVQTILSLLPTPWCDNDRKSALRGQVSRSRAQREFAETK